MHAEALRLNERPWLAAFGCLSSQALIAGGTFNGQLVVWDLSQIGDMQIACSRNTDASHREPICQVRWQYSAEAAARHSNKMEAYHLITLGNEGRILIWNWTKLENPIYG
jgi:hypothetical protein